MSHPFLRSVAAVLSHEATVVLAPSSRWSPSSRSLRPGSTAAHVAQLDNLFVDIMSSIREENPDLHSRVDAAVSSIAQVADGIARLDSSTTPEAYGFVFSPVSPNTDDGSAPARMAESTGSREEKYVGYRSSPAACENDIAPMTPASRFVSKRSKVCSAPKAAGGTDIALTSIPLVSLSKPAAEVASRYLENGGLNGAEGSVTGRKKRYRKPVPSTHCHICCRPSRSVPVAVCGNIAVGICRKSICKLCIVEYELGEWEVVKEPGSGWKCCHCVNECSSVSRAQCFVYSRTNMKRKLKKQRAASEEFAASGAPERFEIQS
jgi:hypothetical protein